MKHEWIGNKESGFILSAAIIVAGKEHTLTTRIGKIKRRGEKRFQWIALPSKWRPDWVSEVKQGIAGSVDEAKAKILACKPLENIVVFMDDTNSLPVKDQIKERSLRI